MIRLVVEWAKQFVQAFELKPDPVLAQIPAARITTDFYPVTKLPGTRCERYYAEKQPNGLLCLKFQSCGGGSAVSNAMADAAMNRPPYPFNLTLAQALVQLRAYDESGKARAGQPWFKAPERDMHYTKAAAILNATDGEKPGLSGPATPRPV